jgi:hypothetical protein
MAFALKKDFYHHREEAELVNKFDNEGLRLMTEERRRKKAARAKAFDDEWLRLTEEARIAFDDGERRHSRHLKGLFEQLRQNDKAACVIILVEECRRNEASRAKGFDDAFLCLKEEARIAFNDEERRHRRHLRALIERLRQHEAARVKGVDDERLRLMAKEGCCHDAATQMARSVARSCADVHHCHEAAAQAAELAVRLLAEDRRRHEATELATMSPMRSLTALIQRWQGLQRRITLPTRSARAMYLLHSEASSISPFSMTPSSPSSLPFTMSSSSTTNSKGRFLDFFRDGEKPVPPRKHSRRHHRSRRTGRRHGPRAPDLQEHLLSGQRHRPRAPNQSTHHGWD